MNKALFLSAALGLFVSTAMPAAAQHSSYGLFQYKTAKQSGANLKKWWAIETSVGAAFTGPVTHSEGLAISTIENPSPTVPDTIVAGTVVARPGAHMNINSNHQIIRITRNTIVSFSAGVDAMLIQSSFGATFAGTREVRNRALYAGQLGVPLTVDFKWGSDVDFDPYVPACFAIGGGVMPAATYAVHGVMNDVNFRVAPYAYASLGFYAGGCWKIRASYTPGNVPIMKGAEKDHQVAVSRLTVGAQNVMTIGVSRMLFSEHWRSARAWRGGRNGGSVGTRMF